MISTTAQTLHIAQTLYAGGGFLTEDADLDAATGKVSAARDAAGLQTTLTYDAAGRLTHSTPPDTQATSYTYSVAGVTPVTVTTETISGGLQRRQDRHPVRVRRVGPPRHREEPFLRRGLERRHHDLR